MKTGLILISVGAWCLLCGFTRIVSFEALRDNRDLFDLEARPLEGKILETGREVELSLDERQVLRAPHPILKFKIGPKNDIFTIEGSKGSKSYVVVYYAKTKYRTKREYRKFYMAEIKKHSRLYNRIIGRVKWSVGKVFSRNYLEYDRISDVYPSKDPEKFIVMLEIDKADPFGNKAPKTHLKPAVVFENRAYVASDAEFDTEAVCLDTRIRDNLLDVQITGFRLMSEGAELCTFVQTMDIQSLRIANRVKLSASPVLVKNVVRRRHLFTSIEGGVSISIMDGHLHITLITSTKFKSYKICCCLLTDFEVSVEDSVYRCPYNIESSNVFSFYLINKNRDVYLVKIQKSGIPIDYEYRIQNLPSSAVVLEKRLVFQSTTGCSLRKSGQGSSIEARFPVDILPLHIEEDSHLRIVVLHPEWRGIVVKVLIECSYITVDGDDVYYVKPGDPRTVYSVKFSIFDLMVLSTGGRNAPDAAVDANVFSPENEHTKVYANCGKYTDVYHMGAPDPFEMSKTQEMKIWVVCSKLQLLVATRRIQERECVYVYKIVFVPGDAETRTTKLAIDALLMYMLPYNKVSRMIFVPSRNMILACGELMDVKDESFRRKTQELKYMQQLEYDTGNEACTEGRWGLVTYLLDLGSSLKLAHNKCKIELLPKSTTSIDDMRVIKVNQKKDKLVLLFTKTDDDPDRTMLYAYRILSEECLFQTKFSMSNPAEIFICDKWGVLVILTSVFDKYPALKRQRILQRVIWAAQYFMLQFYVLNDGGVGEKSIDAKASACWQRPHVLVQYVQPSLIYNQDRTQIVLKMAPVQNCLHHHLEFFKIDNKDIRSIVITLEGHLIDLDMPFRIKMGFRSVECFDDIMIANDVVYGPRVEDGCMYMTDAYSADIQISQTHRDRVVLPIRYLSTSGLLHIRLYHSLYNCIIDLPPLRWSAEKKVAFVSFGETALVIFGRVEIPETQTFATTIHIVSYVTGLADYIIPRFHLYVHTDYSYVKHKTEEEKSRKSRILQIFGLKSGELPPIRMVMLWDFGVYFTNLSASAALQLMSKRLLPKGALGYKTKVLGFIDRIFSDLEETTTAKIIRDAIVQPIYIIQSIPLSIWSWARWRYPHVLRYIRAEARMIWMQVCHGVLLAIGFIFLGAFSISDLKVIIVGLFKKR